MRNLRLSRDVAHTIFTKLHLSGDPDSALDLRGNAYGLGVAEVSRIAKEAGFTLARHTQGEDSSSALLEAPDSAPLHTGWWCSGSDTVSTFEADIVSVKRVPAGSPVSYGYHYRTATETTLVLMSVGFADGLPRSASGKAHVAIAGKTHPIAGRIAMDQCVVDVGDATVTVGDRATVWGENPSIEQWASWANRPSGSILARVGSRVAKTWS
jgi:alanine racemase